MRIRLAVLLSLTFAILLLLPAVSFGHDGAAAIAGASGDGGSAVARMAESGHPWAGSYLQLSPSSLKRTKSRTIWVKYSCTYSTWADGASGWDGWEDLSIVPQPRISGVATVLAWQEDNLSWSYDFEHHNGVLAYCSGRAKVKLTAGSGKKTIRLHFRLFVVDPGSGNFVPNYPISPTYTKSVTLTK